MNLKTLPVLKAVGTINRLTNGAAELPMIRRRVAMRACQIDAAIEAALERGWLVHDDMLTGYWLTETGFAQLPRQADRRVGFKGGAV